MNSVDLLKLLNGINSVLRGAATKAYPARSTLLLRVVAIVAAIGHSRAAFLDRVVQFLAAARKNCDRRIALVEQGIRIAKSVFQGEFVHGVENAAMDFASFQQTDFQADFHRNRMPGILFRSNLSYGTHASSSTPEMVELKSGKSAN
jgi:hypothetical protein